MKWRYQWADRHCLISQDFFNCKRQKPNSNWYKNKIKCIDPHNRNNYKGKNGFKYGRIQVLKCCGWKSLSPSPVSALLCVGFIFRQVSSNGDKDCPTSYQLCSTSLVTLVEKGSTLFSFQQKSWSNSHYLAWIICSSLNQSLWLASIPAESYGWRMGEKCKLWEN